MDRPSSRYSTNNVGSFVDRAYRDALRDGLPAPRFGSALARVTSAITLCQASSTSISGGAVGGAALAIVIGIAVGLIDAGAAFLIGALLAASIPLALIGGLIRLIRNKGVTVQAVLGALAINLTIGLLFASTIGFVSEVQSSPYFTQGSNVTNGDRVYYSFTVMTTTGFGDYTAATPVGRALAVSEMLLGQLYLVTVIGVLVGNYASRRR